MLEWVNWYNNRRLLEPIGNVPPVEYEEVHYRSQETLDMVVGVTQPSLRKDRGGSASQYNRRSKLFIWTATADSTLNKIERLCQTTAGILC